MNGRTIDSEFRITEGTEYTYLASWPAGCKGCRYRVECFATLVPVYQEVVVVRALEGPDAGKVFVCSPHNFSTRYAPVVTIQEDATVRIADPPPPEKVAGYSSEDFRTGA